MGEKTTSKRTNKTTTNKAPRNETISTATHIPTLSRPQCKTPTNKMTKVNSEAIKQLQVLKQAAVINEDFLAAANLKLQIEKITMLEREKIAAVNEEDFLLAMSIKTQIDDL